MRSPRIRPRFTVRSLMIAVALAGLLLGASLWVVKMRSLSAAHRRRAYEVADSMGEDGDRISDAFVTTRDGRSVFVSENENYCRRAAWVHELAEKYWRLADHPWLPVEPDPPPPEPLAHPRSAADCPAELQERRTCRSYADPVYPWWTFLWNWGQRFGASDPRWSFP